MNKLALILAAAIGAPLVTGCATTGQDAKLPWKVAPVLAVRHSAESAEGYYALGRYHDGQDRFAAAIDAYQKALKVDPNYLPAWNALGAAQAQVGRLDDAIASFRRAVALAPDTSHVRNNLGFALLLAGRDVEAATTLRRAIQIDGENRRAWANLATAYGRLGDQDNQELASARANGRWPAVMEDTGAAPPLMPVSATAVTQPAPAAMTPPTAAASVPKSPASPSRSFVATKTERLSLVVRPTAGAVAASTAQAPGRLVRVANNVYELHNAPVTPRPAAKPAPEPEAAAPTPLPSDLRYEVSNGNGRNGLARRVGELLMRDGLPRPRLTNQRPFDQETSVLQYRPGRREAAEKLAARLPFRPTIPAAASVELRGDLRLVLGHDLFTAEACAALDLCPTVAKAAHRPALTATATSR